MLILADYSDENAHSYPSIQRIAIESECSTRTVQRTLAELEKENRITRIIRPGRASTNLYKLNFESFKTADYAHLLPRKSTHDNMSPIIEKVTPMTQKVTPMVIKGDTPVTRTVIEPLEPTTTTTASARERISEMADELENEQLEKIKTAAENSSRTQNPTLDQVLKIVGSTPYPLTTEIATAYHLSRETIGWINKYDKPIKNWHADIQTYAMHWQKYDQSNKYQNAHSNQTSQSNANSNRGDGPQQSRRPHSSSTRAPHARSVKPTTSLPSPIARTISIGKGSAQGSTDSL